MRKILLLIIIIGLLIRVVNFRFGSPILYVVGDEVSNYMSAFNMVSEKTLITKTSQYPPFGSYIQIPFIALSYIYMYLTNQVKSLTEFEFFLTTHEGYFLFIPRIISAVFGSLSIYIVYLITQVLFPKKTYLAYWASFLFAFSLTNIQMSHLAKPWNPSLFFYLLSILFMMKAYHMKKNVVPNILLSAISISISFGFLQIAFYAFMLYGITAMVYIKKINIFNRINKSVLLGGLCVIFFSIFTVNFLITFKPPINFLFSINPDNYSTSLELIFHILKNSGFIFFFNQLITNETVLLSLALPVFITPIAWKKPYLPLTIYILIYFVVCSLLFYKTSRYLLPIIIILPLYAVNTIEYIDSKIRNEFFKKTVATLLVVFTLYSPLAWISVFLRPPTFTQANNWIEQNIEPNVFIASTASRFSKFVPASEAIKVTNRYRVSDYNRLNKYLYPNYYPENVRNIIYLDRLGVVKEEQIDKFVSEFNILYLIDVYWDPIDSFIGNTTQDKYKLVNRFNPTLGNKYTKVSNMYDTLVNPNALTLPFYLKSAGPYIDIIKIKQI